MPELVLSKFVSHLDKVQRSIDRKHNRVLFRTGGFARRVVQQSMRPGGKKRARSKPGEVPRTHTKLLKRGIRFSVDKRKKNVEVFAVSLRDLGSITQVSHSHGAELLEFGGRAQVNVRKRRKRSPERRKKVTVKVQARPYLRRAEHREKYHKAMRDNFTRIPLR